MHSINSSIFTRQKVVLKENNIVIKGWKAFIAYKKSTHLSIVALVINFVMFSCVNVLLVYLAYRFIKSFF